MPYIILSEKCIQLQIPWRNGEMGAFNFSMEINAYRNSGGLHAKEKYLRDLADFKCFSRNISK